MRFIDGVVKILEVNQFKYLFHCVNRYASVQFHQQKEFFEENSRIGNTLSRNCTHFLVVCKLEIALFKKDFPHLFLICFYETY